MFSLRPPLLGGYSLRFVIVLGIPIFIHWSWLLALGWEFSCRAGAYPNLWWNVAEFVAIFCAALLHGVARARMCWHEGGKCCSIAVFPLCGKAATTAPRTLRDRVLIQFAGSAANLVLVALIQVSNALGVQAGVVLGGELTQLIGVANLAVAAVNLLPAYGFDGGEFLEWTLSPQIGRTKALAITSAAGAALALGVIAFAAITVDLATAGIGVYLALCSFIGFQHARLVARMGEAPPRLDFECPDCSANPSAGKFWQCDQCRAPLDPFARRSACPVCAERWLAVECPACKQCHPSHAWSRAARRATAIDADCAENPIDGGHGNASESGIVERPRG